MEYKIPFIKPELPDVSDICNDYTTMVQSNWFTNFGPFEVKFSADISKFIGRDTFATTVNNATSGLILSILALLGKGDGSSCIIMPSFTFIAGAQAVEWCGYKPCFVDINLDDFNMNIEDTKRLLEATNNDISAILFCNSFGVGSTEIVEWERLADEYSIPLIIDSAAGFGSKYTKTEFVGSRGSCEIFSFHATKPLAVGEGGAVTSKSSDLIQRIRQLENFGFNNDRVSNQLGLNAKMQELNAAIGLRQLKLHNKRVFNRQANLRLYKNLLNKNVTFQSNDELSSVCFVSIILPGTVDRDEVHDKMIQAGIEVRKYYNPALHNQDYYKNKIDTCDLNTTEYVCKHILSLPMHDGMDKRLIEHISSELNNIIRGK